MIHPCAPSVLFLDCGHAGGPWNSKKRNEGVGEQLLSGFVKKINLSKSICTADMKLLLQRICVGVPVQRGKG